MSKGFIPIRRTLFEHFLFKERRVFSRFEAWLDLIQLASFTNDNSDFINGKIITKHRGEVVASLRYLMTRWSWSMHKLCDFLELLRSQDMVVVDKENGISKITLLNYEKHNPLTEEEFNEEKNSKRNRKGNSKSLNGSEFPKNKGTPTGTEKGTNGEQGGNTEGTNSNKDNNSKKDNGGADAPDLKKIELEKKQKEFGKSLIPHVNVYGKEMIREFFDYWSEPNKSVTKMKWQLEETWDLKKRLDRWQRNEDKFNKNGSSKKDKPVVSEINEKLKQA
jgi:hypothetical protein